MAKNRHASGTPRPDLAVVSADTRHARHGRAKASVKRKRQVRPARERPRRSPRPRWRGRMPSQSALELRSEHWSARARGRHDRDEIVTLLWQRVPAGADNSRRDWSGTPPAAAGSRWRATDVVRREYRRRPAARMARRVRSTTDASTSSGARRSCKVERKLGGARSTSAAVPSMCSRHKRKSAEPEDHRRRDADAGVVRAIECQGDLIGVRPLTNAREDVGRP